jgi:hypothetical protein
MTLFQNKREKTLAAMLIAVLAILAIGLGGRFVMNFRRDLETKIVLAEGAHLEAEGWIGEEAFWRQRGAWLESKQPVMREPRQDSLELLQNIETSARAHGVEVTARMIKEVVHTSQYSGTPIRVDVAGEFAGLVAWLHELQRPGNFLLIHELTIKASNKPSIVDCSVEVMRCYRPSGEGRES